MSKWIFAAIGSVIGFGVGYYYAKTRENTRGMWTNSMTKTENKGTGRKGEYFRYPPREDVKTKVEYDSIIKNQDMARKMERRMERNGYRIFMRFRRMIWAIWTIKL